MSKRDDYRIRRVLLKLGISSNLKGYKYILTILPILQENKITMGKAYKEIYKKEQAKSVSDVERGIRYSIEKSYKTRKLLKNIYGRQPKVKEFLYDLIYNIDIFEEELKGDK